MLETIVSIGILGIMLGDKDKRKKKKELKHVGDTENGWFWYRWNNAESDWDRAVVMRNNGKNMRGEDLPPYYLDSCPNEEYFLDQLRRNNNTTWKKSYEETNEIIREVNEWAKERGVNVLIV